MIFLSLVNELMACIVHFFVTLSCFLTFLYEIILTIDAIILSFKMNMSFDQCSIYFMILSFRFRIFFICEIMMENDVIVCYLMFILVTFIIFISYHALLYFDFTVFLQNCHIDSLFLLIRYFIFLILLFPK